jgi:hypothetical protein
LEAWYCTLLPAFLEAGGWHTVADALPVEDDTLQPGELEFELPNDS